MHLNAFVYIGNIPSESLATWPNRVTDRVIITAERRIHYLERHPEVEDLEYDLLEAIRNPEELHLYPRDRTIANIYRQIDLRHDIVASVLISHEHGIMNSVMTARISRRRDRESGLRRGTLLWRYQK